MKEYNPICFLAYLIEHSKSSSLQLTVRKFNEELHKIEDSLWNQHYHIGFGFNDFVEVCSTRFSEWIHSSPVLTININKEFKEILKNYIKIYDTPNYFYKELI